MPQVGTPGLDVAGLSCREFHVLLRFQVCTAQSAKCGKFAQDFFRFLLFAH